jgi:hypothetical protein
MEIIRIGKYTEIIGRIIHKLSLSGCSWWLCPSKDGRNRWGQLQGLLLMYDHSLEIKSHFETRLTSFKNLRVLMVL